VAGARVGCPVPASSGGLLEGVLGEQSIRATPAQAMSSRIGPTLSYVSALDGIRAVSIAGIMLNHGGISWAGGGVISVNVFFVLSGFLISTLLVKEWSASSTVSLRRFWARRARRLLPALLVLLVGIALYAWLLVPASARSAIRLDGLATLFYVGNWHQILTKQSYFALGAQPSPLLHTWTLAIEEQFYVIWPLVVLGILKLWRSIRVLLVVTILGALASALEMAVLYHPGMDPSRLYYGTDTRAQDLLVGAALAFILFGRPRAQTPGGRRAMSVVATVGALGFAVEFARLGSASAFAFRGGFLLADLLVALVILGVYQAPTGLPARILGVRPVAYIGKISYGLYLWHWPVFLWLDHARTGLGGTPLFALRCAVSVVIASLSYHLVEQPIRRGAVRSWRSWVLAPVAAGATAVALLVATAAPATASVPLGSGPVPAAPIASSTPGTVHVLIEGDSLALTVFFGMLQGEGNYDVAMDLGAHVGCGIAVTTPLEVRGVVGVPFTNCPEWPGWYAASVQRYHPQVVALILGHWETVNRMFDGRWQHLGDPQFDAYETAQLQRAITILSAGGARVALMTSPYFDTGEQPDGAPWPEDDPARVQEYNAIVEAATRRDPSVVSVVPLNTYLDPDGHFTWTIDGQVVRQPDGIHITGPGGTYLAPLLLPALHALGQGRSVVGRPSAPTPAVSGVPGG